MTLPLLAILVLLVLTAGYVLYGTLIGRFYRLDDSATTPAVARADGTDFVPTRPFYLLPQHFSAIAAAGPIAGPILACGTFGWLPCLLWIGFGVIFIGAVHDFSALVASVRHGSHSIAEITKQNLGRRAWLSLSIFIWLALVYVIVAFTQMTAASFVGISEELEGIGGTFNKGGAVAASSVMYLLLSLTMGLITKFFRPPLWLVTPVFVAATLACVWLGTRLDTVLVFSAQTWFIAILGYCLVASMLPVWLLQQPRGYLGGFVLYLAIGIGVVGILAGGFSIRQPMVSDQAARLLDPLAALRLTDSAGSGAVTQMVVPFLFVTIACGACSGFHGLICGGTTSKQIAKESHCKPVAFGAMLLEGFVAVIALATMMMLSPAEAKGLPPARIYGDGLASFLTVMLGKDAFLFASTFGAMAFSTFVFDTLDVSTRLGRYLLQEVFGAPSKPAGWIASLVTAATPLTILLTSDPKGYLLYWTLFGTSNQLLAALTLLGITVWLRRAGKRSWFVAIPMLFLMGITLSALAMQIAAGFRAAWSRGALGQDGLNALVACMLLVLAGVFIVEAVRRCRVAAQNSPSTASTLKNR